MDALYATQKLWNWFSEKDAFSVKNIKDLFLVIDDYEETLAATIVALNELEKLNLIVRANFESDNKKYEYWVLKKPFNSYEQPITICAPIAASIAEIVNNLVEDSNCNPSNIQENDIKNLITVCYEILKDEKDEENN